MYLQYHHDHRHPSLPYSHFHLSSFPRNVSMEMGRRAELTTSLDIHTKTCKVPQN